MDFLDLLPVHITAGFRFFQPGQVRVVGHHAVDHAAHRRLVDLFHVDGEPFGGFNGQVALGHNGRLQQGFVGEALAFHLVPGQVSLAFFVGLAHQILHRFKGNVPAAFEGDVAVTADLCRLIVLVTFAVDDQVATCVQFGGEIGDFLDFILPVTFGAVVAVLVGFREVVIAVLCGQQGNVIAGFQMHVTAAFQLGSDGNQVVARVQAQVTPGIQGALLLTHGVVGTGAFFIAAFGVVVIVIFIRRCLDEDIPL